MALRFLHCSDIHLLSLTGVGPHRFLNKRLTGGINLMLARGRHHSAKLFDRMVEHARDLAVDRVVVTGDLSNLALDEEFVHIVDKLEGIGLPVTVIPGNHDTYTRASARQRRFEHHFTPYMQGERLSDEDEHFYPFVQRFGEVALIGVSTAQASLPLYAIGSVGSAQLGRLDRVLEALGRDALVRVVLIHHPVMPGVAAARHGLTDLDAFGEVIARRGAELILHGHEHELIEGTLAGPERLVPVHGISSATNLSQRPGRAAAFSVYTIDRGGIGRTIWAWDGADFRPTA